ncbi:hypothetical protein ES703_40635 [subsurface metagenome]|nr:hypothetical protein [Dehalococcoidia bacterium]
MNPRRKARKEEQLTGELSGDFATYEKFGLFQRAIARRTAHRYRGVLLMYQESLAEVTCPPKRSPVSC